MTSRSSALRGSWQHDTQNSYERQQELPPSPTSQLQHENGVDNASTGGKPPGPLPRPAAASTCFVGSNAISNAISPTFLSSLPSSSVVACASKLSGSSAWIVVAARASAALPGKAPSFGNGFAVQHPGRRTSLSVRGHTRPSESASSTFPCTVFRQACCRMCPPFASPKGATVSPLSPSLCLNSFRDPPERGSPERSDNASVRRSTSTTEGMASGPRLTLEWRRRRPCTSPPATPSDGLDDAQASSLKLTKRHVPHATRSTSNNSRRRGGCPDKIRGNRPRPGLRRLPLPTESTRRCAPRASSPAILRLLKSRKRGVASMRYTPCQV